MSRLKNALRADRSRYALLMVWGTWFTASPVLAAPPWSTTKATTVADVEATLYSGLTVVENGASDSTMREKAAASLPLQELSVDAREKASSVLANLSLFRHLPTLQFAVEADVYQFLLSHPDVAVSSWRAMEISRFELRPTGENRYHADARDGSVGLVEVWKSTRDETIIYCDGAFKSPLLVKPIVARSVMRLKTRFFKGADGEPRAEHTGDVFVAFPSQTVETVARMISPVSHTIADRNFKQLTLYVHLMSTAMARQPGWVQSMVRRMDATESQRQELLDLAATVRRSAELRTQAAMLNPIPVESILAPLRENVEPPLTTATAVPMSPGVIRK